MKLTKENVYINLRGKSKEELNLITEITGVGNLKNYYYLHFYTPLNKWIRYHVWTDNTENKTEVTIEQLKEIIKPMEEFTPISMRCTQEQFEAIKPKLNKKKSLRVFLFNKEWDSFYLALLKDGGITNGLIHSNNGEIHEEWNEDIFLKACGIGVETLQEKEQRLLEELEEVRKEIEDSKIKVGDLVKCTNKESRAKCIVGVVEDLHPDYVGVGGHWYDKFEKISDSVLLESLNKLF